MSLAYKLHLFKYMQSDVLKIVPKKRWCPKLENPIEGCYCVRMTSQDIERAVFLCGNHYELCEIFRKNNGKKGEKGNGH